MGRERSIVQFPDGSRQFVPIDGLDWTDIATLRAKVAELGLRLPAQLVDEVEGDGRRRAGNRIVRHLADGPPVTLLAG